MIGGNMNEPTNSSNKNRSEATREGNWQFSMEHRGIVASQILECVDRPQELAGFSDQWNFRPCAEIRIPQILDGTIGPNSLLVLVRLI